ncbi:MAG TPA: tRNA (5-methylaminomethyl-2-thiouridine)(34)-methyltransferase MnmD, partial [Agriterribacter sp.]|nr:tRNA (5-methylaminomethyl-2-thiouridine)(34)-methyltransferase MnmD [Agriterribacter sp.]
VYGAVQESRHVYVEAGLYYWMHKQPEPAAVLHILEVGFGTGLNALLTLQATAEKQFAIHYHAIEPFPLHEQELSGLNYCAALRRPDLELPFRQMHRTAGSEPVPVSPRFTLYNHCTTVQEFRYPSLFGLVYYDAFAPGVQPGLWTAAVFENLFHRMSAGGILVTYCCKGDVRRNLLSAGFAVEKIPGPAHKREMIRAVKA